MSQTFKYYLRSSFITFVSAFALVVVAHMDSGVAWEEGALAGVIMAGVRAGIKALATMVMGWEA